MLNPEHRGTIWTPLEEDAPSLQDDPVLSFGAVKVVLNLCGGDPENESNLESNLASNIDEKCTIQTKAGAFYRKLVLTGLRGCSWICGSGI